MGVYLKIKRILNMQDECFRQIKKVLHDKSNKWHKIPSQAGEKKTDRVAEANRIFALVKQTCKDKDCGFVLSAVALESLVFQIVIKELMKKIPEHRPLTEQVGTKVVRDPSYRFKGNRSFIDQQHFQLRCYDRAFDRSVLRAQEVEGKLPGSMISGSGNDANEDGESWCSYMTDYYDVSAGTKAQGEDKPLLVHMLDVKGILGRAMIYLGFDKEDAEKFMTDLREQVEQLKSQLPNKVTHVCLFENEEDCEKLFVSREYGCQDEKTLGFSDQDKLDLLKTDNASESGETALRPSNVSSLIRFWGIRLDSPDLQLIRVYSNKDEKEAVIKLKNHVKTQINTLNIGDLPIRTDSGRTNSSYVSNDVENNSGCWDSCLNFLCCLGGRSDQRNSSSRSSLYKSFLSSDS